MQREAAEAAEKPDFDDCERVQPGHPPLHFHVTTASFSYRHKLSCYFLGIIGFIITDWILSERFSVLDYLMKSIEFDETTKQKAR